jgi:hypothetical protein
MSTRLDVFLPTPLADEIASEAARPGISRGELVRRALRLYLEPAEQHSAPLIPTVATAARVPPPVAAPRALHKAPKHSDSHPWKRAMLAARKRKEART